MPSKMKTKASLKKRESLSPPRSIVSRRGQIETNSHFKYGPNMSSYWMIWIDSEKRFHTDPFKVQWAGGVRRDWNPNQPVGAALVFTSQGAAANYIDTCERIKESPIPSWTIKEFDAPTAVAKLRDMRGRWEAHFFLLDRETPLGEVGEIFDRSLYSIQEADIVLVEGDREGADGRRPR